MMEIVQQQLTQLMAEIVEVNAQIQKITTSLTSEPLVEEQSNEIGNVFLPENKVSKGWIYTDKATSEDRNKIEEHIKHLCENKASASNIKGFIKTQEGNSVLVHI